MEVMFTAHKDDSPGKFYMAVAEAGEWKKLAEDLDDLNYRSGFLSPASRKLIEQLKSWGIEA